MTTVAFELDGQAFTALNGGPMFKFNEAVSFQIHSETQEDVDYYREKLSEGGDEKAQQCGWLAKSQRVMAVMLQMKKIDIDALKRAFAG